MRLGALVLFAVAGLVVSQAVAQTVPPSVPISVYGRVPSARNLALSPSGKFIMARVSEGGKTVLEVKDAETLAVVSRFNMPGVKLRALQWADDTHIILSYSVAAQVIDISGPKREWMLGMAFDLKTGKVRKLLASNNGLNTLLAIPVVVPDAKSGFSLVLYAETFPSNRSVLTIISEREGYSKPIDVGTEATYDYVIGPDGAILGRIDYVQSTGRWRVMVGFDRWNLQFVRAGNDLFSPPSFAGVSADGKIVYIRQTDEDATHVYPIDVAKAAWGEPLPDLDDQGLVQTPNNQVVIAASKTDLEGTNYTFFDPKDQALWRGVLKAFKGAKVDFQSVSDDRMKYIVLVDGGNFGYGYYLIDRKAGAAKFLYDAYTAIGPDQMAPVSVIHYKAADGFDIPAYLTLPKGKTKELPLIVLPHGGPFARDEAGFDWWPQAYASLGYAVLQPQFRGSAGLGFDHLRAGYGEYGRKMQTDLSDGVADLAKQGVIDPARVAIVGASYGGYAALAGVTLQSGIYRCAVSIAGPADTRRQLDYLKLKYGDSRTPVTRYWRQYLDIKTEADPILTTISPIFHVDKASSPILLIHGSDDTVVVPEQSRRMADALKKAGKSVKYLELKGEDHDLS